MESDSLLGANGQGLRSINLQYELSKLKRDEKTCFCNIRIIYI